MFKDLQSFESAAVSELIHIAESIDSQVDAIGAESVELHDGVLQLEFAKGTFVVNKHGASGQIWYSSPISPPAYFDPVSGPNVSEVSWYSRRLRKSLREKFAADILVISGHRVGI